MKQEPSKTQLWCAGISAGLFFGVLAFFMLWSIFAPKRSFSEQENRVLQELPPFTVDSLLSRSPSDKFTARYEAYVADQFVLRDSFVTVKNETERFLGKRDLNGVYLADNGYLIARETTFDTENFAQNLAFVKSFQTTLQTENASLRFALSLCPNSGEILADLLPPFAHNRSLDEDYRTAEELFGASATSPRMTLMEHREEDLYYRTDHHWTSYGAFLAYQSLGGVLDFTPHSIEDYKVECVSDSFYGTYQSKVNLPIAADKMERFSLIKNASEVRVTDQNGDKAPFYDDKALEGKDKYNYFLGGNKPFLRIDTSVSNERKLLVIKDSYAHELIPFLTDHYEQILCVDLRYYQGSLQSLAKDYEITDVLVLYETMNFQQDGNLFKLAIPS